MVFFMVMGSTLKVPLPSVMWGGCCGRSAMRIGASSSWVRSASEGISRPSAALSSMADCAVPSWKQKAPAS